MHRSTRIGRVSALVALLGTAGLPAAVLTASAPPAAAATSGTTQPARLARVLAADGSLKPGAHGSFDAHGYRMVLGPGGAPHFVATTASSSWSEAYGVVGAPDVSALNAVAVNGSDIYIGGEFSKLSYDAGVVLNNVAEWDGQGWKALGKGSAAGVGGVVDSLAYANKTLYVGGRFTTAGGKPASNVASWTAAGWSSLGSGMTSASNQADVKALAVIGTEVYAAGVFDTAGGVGAASIASWNGTTWSPLGRGVTECSYFDVPNHCSGTPAEATVNALAVSGTTLYVGGGFNYVSSTELDGLAAWNGTAWTGVGGVGVAQNAGAGQVFALAVSGTTLYVGGDFTAAGGTSPGQGGTPAASIASYNGTSWQAYGTGATTCCGNATVDAVAVSNGTLYMAGNFTSAGGDGKADIAQWSGTAWQPLGAGLDGAPSQLVSGKSGLIAAGIFSSSPGKAILNNIGLWTGSAWKGYGQGLSSGASAGQVYALAGSGANLYAAGTFSNGGSVPVPSLAQFTGTAWKPLKGGVSGNGGFIDTIAVDGSDVYVGGSFTTVAGVAASNVAMWDGTKWHALRGGVDGRVYTIMVNGAEVWVGGSFTHADGNPANEVAIWTPGTTTWSAMGGGPGFSGTVQSLVVLGAPYAGWIGIGGNFAQIDIPGPVTVNSFILFDPSATITGPGSGTYYLGTSANPGFTVSAGAAATVHSTVFDNGTLWFGGNFIEAGTTPCGGLVGDDLNAGAWVVPGLLDAGSGTAIVQSMVKVGTAIYLGGTFTTAGTITSPDAVEFQPGTGFSSMGGGMATAAPYNTPGVTSLAQTTQGLYLGGNFGLAGKTPAENVALWTATAGQAAG